MLPTLQLTRAALKCWFTWNCSPPYARITSSLARLFVAFAGTKHCCLTAVNRDGALCCPDFPRDRGLKPYAFLPLSRDRPIHYFLFASLTLCVLCSGCVASRDCLPSFIGSPKIFNFWGQANCDMSGIRESNPPPRLGKPMHYRCANAANNFRCKGSKNIARMQIFCLKVQKKTTTPLLMGSRQATNHTKKDALQRLLWVTSGALARLPFATRNYYVVKSSHDISLSPKKCAFSLQCTIVFGDPSFNGFSPNH